MRAAVVVDKGTALRTILMGEPRFRPKEKRARPMCDASRRLVVALEDARVACDWLKKSPRRGPPDPELKSKLRRGQN